MADLTDADIREWGALIRRAAISVTHDYPDIEIDDTIGEVWCALLELQAQGVMTHTSEKNAYQTLRYAAQRYAHGQRKLQLSISPQYAYRTKDIRKLFEDYFDKETWLDAEVPEDAQSELGPVQLELMGDLGRGYDRLNPGYKMIIFRAFALKDTKSFSKSELMRLTNALRRCRDILNTYQPRGHHNGPGSRVVITNAEANHFIGENN